MRRGTALADIRTTGAEVPRPPGPPRIPVLIAVAVVAAMALAAVVLTDTSDDLSIAIPDLGPETTTTLTPPPTISVDPSGDDAALPNPLDTLVPEFADTLILTAATGDGIEVWTWTTGANGTLSRSALGENLYDATPDASGSSVAALRRYGHDGPWLVVAHDGDAVPVFYGARSFAWHRTEPGRIAWLSQLPGEDAPTLYLGTRNDGGMYFQPLTLLSGFDAFAGDRLVGYDDTGFVIERWNVAAGDHPTVARLDPYGDPGSSSPGTFSGLSDDSGVAVSGEASTAIESGVGMVFQRSLPAAASSVAWWTGGTSLAYTTLEGSSVVVVSGGSAVREYDLGVSRPVAAAWSPDGRFLVVTGHAGDAPMLLFVDMADGSIDAVAIDATPIRAVVVP